MISVKNLREKLCTIDKLQEGQYQTYHACQSYTGLIDAIKQVMPLEYEVHGKRVQAGQSSAQIGTHVDKEIGQCAALARSLIDTTIAKCGDDDIIDYYTLIGNVYDNTPECTHSYSQTIVLKLRDLLLIPVASQILVVDDDGNIRSAVDLLCIGIRSGNKRIREVQYVTVEQKTGYNQGIYGRSNVNIDDRYGGLPVSTKTRHLFQLFFYYRWLQERGVQTHPMLLIVNENTAKQKQKCRVIDLPKELRDDTIVAHNLLTAIRYRTPVCKTSVPDIRENFKRL